MMRCVPPLSLLTIAFVIPSSTSAQWGRHFAVAAGPAIAVDDTPPYAGVHFRTSAALSPGPRTLNLLADAYITWMAPGTLEQPVTGGSFAVRDQETQLGVGLSGLLSFLRRGSVSPYLLVGGVYRWSDANRRLEARDDSGQVIDQVELSQNEDQFDILLGLGTAIHWGNRRLLLEARLYGGMAINMPITIGLSL